MDVYKDKQARAGGEHTLQPCATGISKTLLYGKQLPALLWRKSAMLSILCLRVLFSGCPAQY